MSESVDCNEAEMAFVGSWANPHSEVDKLSVHAFFVLFMLVCVAVGPLAIRGWISGRRNNDVSRKICQGRVNHCIF